MVKDPGEPTHAAFLGLRLRVLESLISAQGKDLLSKSNIAVSNSCVSVMCLIASRGKTTVSEITAALGLSRQLVLQRLALLEARNFIDSKTDAADRRSRLIELSKAGKREFKKLALLLPQIEAAFLTLNEEVGADLSAVLHAAEMALKRRSLSDRIAAANAANDKSAA